MIVCSIAKGGEAIGCTKMISIYTGVSGVMAIKEEAAVSVDNGVLKVIES